MTQFTSSLFLELISHIHSQEQLCGHVGIVWILVLMALLEWGLQKLHVQLLKYFNQGEKEKHKEWPSTVLQRWQLSCSYKVKTKVKEDFRDSQPGLVIAHRVSCNFKWRHRWFKAQLNLLSLKCLYTHTSHVIMYIILMMYICHVSRLLAVGLWDENYQEIEQYVGNSYPNVAGHGNCL